MFHKVIKVKPIENYIIEVIFENNVIKLYDVSILFEKWKAFKELKNNELFNQVKVDIGGYGISWNEELDLSCNELWDNGYTKNNK